MRMIESPVPVGRQHPPQLEGKPPLWIVVPDPAASPEHAEALAACIRMFEGHADCLLWGALATATTDELIGQLVAECDKALTKGRAIFLIGTGLGGALAILASREADIRGVVGISTLVSPTDLGRFSRVKRTNSPYSRASRPGATPGFACDVASGRLRPSVERVLSSAGTPTLLIHSTGDEVADYRAVADLAASLQSDRLHLVTLADLDHRLLESIPAQRVVELAHRFFRLDPPRALVGPEPPREEAPEVLASRIAEANAEARHWSQLIFQIMIGFFSVMGALLYVTLPDVFAGNAKAPYYLLTYSFMCNLYVLLFGVHFFYLNRTDVYIKYHIEPLVPETTWVGFRTASALSGRASTTLTDSLAAIFVAVPILASLGVLVFCLVEHRAPILATQPGGLLLGVVALLDVLTWSLGLHVVAVASKYASTHLYLAPTLPSRDPAFRFALARLYHAVRA